jgi:hypothetical protein
MRFDIIFPYPSIINADSYKEAIKNYIIMDHETQINNLIITNQINHMNARIKYYQQNGKNKVGIDMYPINYQPNNLLMSGVNPLMSGVNPLMSGVNPLMPNGLPMVLKIPI